jgi:hypothetical protein
MQDLVDQQHQPIPLAMNTEEDLSSTHRPVGVVHKTNLLLRHRYASKSDLLVADLPNKERA